MKRYIKVLLMMLLCVWGWSTKSHAVEPPKPVFTLDFSQGENAVSASGEKIPARVEGTFIMQDTPRGKALKSGPNTGYLHFPAKDIINPNEGTIEMWINPIDWSSDGKFHVFFDARGATGQGALYLYKYFTGDLLLMLSTPNGGAPYYSANARYRDWRPGEWHFIVGTWSPTHLSVYIDGKLERTLERVELPKSIKEFMIGDNPWSNEGGKFTRDTHTLVTDVRIYDRMLKPEHIAAHYKGNYDAVVPLTDNSPTLKQEHDINTYQMTSTLNLLGIDMGDASAKVQFSLQRDRRVISKNKLQDASSITTSTFSTKNLTPGTYQVVADISAGDQHATSRSNFIVPDTSWIGNNIGKEDKVLPPWIPVQTKNIRGNISVKVWGREYQFNKAAFPTQVIAQNQPMLSHPVTLKVLLSDGQLQWRNESVKVKKATPTHTILEGSAEANSPQGKVLLTTNIRIDYDGLIWISTEMQTPQGFDVKSMNLDIPMREQNAIYRHNWSGGRNNADYKSGALPAGTGILQENKFQPYSWIGDNDRGLVWFCETAEHWPNFKNEDAFQIRRDEGSVITRLNFLEGQSLPQKWNFEFGLQATPVKPIPADWRKWRIKPSNGVDAVGTTAAVPWPSSHQDTTKYFGYPDARNPEAYEKMVEKHHKEGKAVLPVLFLNGIVESAPEWTWFSKKWESDQGENNLDGYLHYVPQTAEYWQDFIVWKIDQFHKRYKFDGAYHDLTYVYGWNTPSAGTGWFDGKEWQKTYPFMAYRELYRRSYAAFKGSDPNSFIIAHNSPVELMPVLSYVDAYLGGEAPLRDQMRGKSNYTDVFGLDQWRTEFVGKHWGIIPFFLSQFDTNHAKEEKPTRGLMALAMLHDTLVWGSPGVTNVPTVDKMYEALDKFGYQKSTFIPYWSEQPPASTEMKDVYISAYKRDDGRALVVVGNTSSEPRKGNIVLNPKSLGLPAGKVLSWPEGTPVSVDNNTISIDMDGLDYQLLLWEIYPLK